MTAKECIRERRSIRQFKEDKIDHALLSEIIETASYAPSWKIYILCRIVTVVECLRMCYINTREKIYQHRL